MRGELPNVVDPETVRARVLSRKCDTCIFRPGNLMHLMPGRKDEMAAEAVAQDGWITCHSTLEPYPAAAVCRGFWDVHRNESFFTRFAAWSGHYTEVEPPVKEQT